MPTPAQTLRNFVNQFINVDAVKAFQNNRMNTALNQLISFYETLSAGVHEARPYHVTQANFINATDCPIPALKGKSISVFMNTDDTKRFLRTWGTAEWTDLVDGGFKILIDGFDATSGENLDFYVWPTINL